MISAEVRARIRRLFFAEHWKVGTIASELGVHHDTVRLAIEIDRFGHTRVDPRPSLLDPYKSFIIDTLEKHPRLRSTRIFEMVRARGYLGGVVVVRRYVRRVRPASRAEAFLRLDTLPGEQAQVDWGSFGKIRIGNAERALSCFVLVLSWSRAFFARFTLDQTLESFLRSHVEAFERLGGIPRIILYDNLKTVVLERVGEHIRFQPQFLEFAGHHHFAPQPCAPSRGNEKGKVERAIQYLRTSFFAARPISSIEKLNRELSAWIDEIAEARAVPNDPDRRQVKDALALERAHLLSLPEHRFACDLVKPIASGKRPYVRFDLNDYSIPHRLVRKPLTLSASDEIVRVLDGLDEVACHKRSYDRGRVLEDPAHFEALVQEKRHASELRSRDRLRGLCLHADPLLEGICVRGTSLGHQTKLLVRLLDQYGATLLDAAIAEAIERRAFSAYSVAHLCDQRARARKQPPPLDMVLDDPRARDLRVTPHALADYDALGTNDSKEQK